MVRSPSLKQKKWYYHTYLKYFLPFLTETNFLDCFENSQLDIETKRNLEINVMLNHDLSEIEKRFNIYIKKMKNLFTNFNEFYLSSILEHLNITEDEKIKKRAFYENNPIIVKEFKWNYDSLDIFLTESFEPLQIIFEKAFIPDLKKDNTSSEIIEKTIWYSKQFLSVAKKGRSLIKKYKEVNRELNQIYLHPLGKLTTYSALFSLFPKDFLKVFDDDFTHLIERAISINKSETLQLFSDFIRKCQILTTNQNNEKLNEFPSEKRALEEISLDPINQIMKDTTLPETQKFLKTFSKIYGLDGSSFLVDCEKVFSKWEEIWKKQDIIKARYALIDWYESFSIVSGLFLGLFDIFQKVFDNNTDRSYLSADLYTNNGLYSCGRLIWDSSSGSRKKDPQKRQNLQTYIQNSNYSGIAKLFSWLFSDVAKIRNALHEGSLVEQKSYDKDKISIHKGSTVIEIEFDKIMQTVFELNILFIAIYSRVNVCF